MDIIYIYMQQNSEFPFILLLLWKGALHISWMLQKPIQFCWSWMNSDLLWIHLSTNKVVLKRRERHGDWVDSAWDSECTGCGFKSQCCQMTDYGVLHIYEWYLTWLKSLGVCCHVSVIGTHQGHMWSVRTCPTTILPPTISRSDDNWCT